jgi:hypothetical protein
MKIIDEFLPDAHRVRRDALCAPFIDFNAPDGETYKRVCMAEVPGLRESLERHVGPVSIHAMGYRLNYNGEMPNTAIHSDLGWGTKAVVLYLCDGEGGTAFWRHKATGAERIGPADAELLSKVEGDWDDAEAWDQVELAPLKFNRAVIYDGLRFHSRWPFEAFGTTPEDGRLIAVAFFS